MTLGCALCLCPLKNKGTGTTSSALVPIHNLGTTQEQAQLRINY